MTADLCTEEDSEHKTQQTTDASFPAAILQIFEYLSGNNKIVFKSQQIDDPELQRNEKAQIAKDIYSQNRQTFLQRFGSYLKEQHLSDFSRLAISKDATPLNQHESSTEIQDLLQDYKRRLVSKECDIKNRRYAALQDLIKKGEYFSEHEMMKRAPELYQDLIGQYLSENEKKQRDSYDVKNTTFSGILMHTMDQKQLDEILKQADESIIKNTSEIIENDDDTTQSSTSFKRLSRRGSVVEEEEEEEDGDRLTAKPDSKPGYDTDDEEVPQDCRTLWGDFDNEQIACRISEPQTSNTKKTKSKHKGTSSKLITAGERDLLRQEFVGIMHQNFLAGKDKDFDYTQVDDNTQYDDLNQMNQDKEDEYFATSDDDSVDNIISTTNGQQSTLIRDIKHSTREDIADESEDELDIYMSHLKNHHSLQI